MQPGYFEAILQIRNPTPELREYVMQQLKQHKVHIAKERKYAHGFDLYCSSRRFLLTLGQLLRDNYSGELKISRQLFTRNRQTSRDVHRVTVLFSFHDLHHGRIYLYRGEQVRVFGMGKKVSVKYVKTGKKALLYYEDLKPLT